MPIINRKKLKPHKFIEDGITYLVRLPDIYDGNGSNIGSALGISKLDDTYEPDPKDQQITVSDGQKQGRILKIRISYLEGTQRKTSVIICPVGKSNTAVTQLLSKSFEGGSNIVGAGFPRRRRLS